MSNLRLINETTGTSVSNISVTDVFSSDYDIYKIVISNVDGASTSHWTKLRLINSSGSIVSASNYDFAMLETKAWDGTSENKRTSQSSFEYIFIDSDSNVGAGGVGYIFNPTSTSSYTFTLGQSQAFYSTNGGEGTKYIGALKQTASMSGFQLLRTSGSYDTITIRTYGLRVDS